MEKKVLDHLIIGQMLLALVLFSGCGGGSTGSSSTASTPTTATPTTPPPTDPPIYDTSSVGGTVSGLIGTGLVLQNNGTDDLAISVDETTFKFPTRVLEGSKTIVTILTQPTNPQQSCEVINGDRIVTADNIVDVEVRCITNINETFDSGRLDSGYWNTSGQYDRKLVDSKLQFNLAATGEFAFDHLPFQDKNCGKVSADVTISDTVFTGTGASDFRTRMQNCGYHSDMAGEAPGNQTGDVEAAIIWNGGGTQASYVVFRCINDDCNNVDSIEYLTPNGSTGVLLGTTPQNSTATLSIDWNNSLYPEQFAFQLNNDPPKIFDPVNAGAAIAAGVPNKPLKYLGVQIYLQEPNDTAEMTATVDNVTDGLLADNFDITNEKYLDGSFWKKTNGRRQIENDRLVMESAQEFVDDPVADNRFNNTTTLHSNDEMIITGTKVVEADLSLDPATYVVDSGSNPAEVYALLEMEFQPPGSLKNDFTNFFVVRAALKEGPPGVTAEIFAEGCADAACSAKYTIAGAEQPFASPVVKGQPYHFKIENLGNGAFNITMDGIETISLDLSSVPEFASTAFSGVEVSTASRGTDLPGEEAFIRAYFDNVRTGSL